MCIGCIAGRRCATTIAVIMLGVAGCSGSGDHLTVTPASGTVTYAGQPVANAQVVFRSKGSAPAATASFTKLRRSIAASGTGEEGSAVSESGESCCELMVQAPGGGGQALDTTLAPAAHQPAAGVFCFSRNRLSNSVLSTDIVAGQP